MDRTHWNLWHGYAGIGKETMRRLHPSLGIPLEALLQIDPVPARKPLAPATTPSCRRGRGRPRQPRQTDASRAAQRDEPPGTPEPPPAQA